ncbi:AAA-type ATPase family protein / ankyrin repeat family protein [Galdieria sulphuraria]|uniref:AAA-type ATPase family protein / ankyrin repeat family protein n=1 Tax=Galdieria sulphuraria TaxID=130081 RepID=M2W4M3_GALSU|nr:AAA-type ATPase family protein / ankyrin repeat family protein [Galdieria sulphuraria]EME30696.1 AAA-type ATPase family protein / ankyrin repeat family protein [Galdieria sulphuraria]|eukprot:XP_005707216.1 AAA-type ATPase family protein / ankyrin repeat family protein [Galdieria sulphuraria]
MSFYSIHYAFCNNNSIFSWKKHYSHFLRGISCPKDCYLVQSPKKHCALTLLAQSDDGAVGGDASRGYTRRLSDALRERDIEAKKEREENERRKEEQERARMEKERKKHLLKEIPDETQAGTVDEYMYKEGVSEVLDSLDVDLIGLLPVKRRVREIAALLVIDKLRAKIGLDTAVPSLHMCFTGSPGTGKTTVAMRMGQILKKMGYCRQGHLVVATRDDLVGQYVGHTAPKTKEVIKKAMGGVLLIDEAYYLYNAANEKDYGVESIEILLNIMENNKDDLVVVLAGYEDKMNKFFSYIPGMKSRIGNHITFPDYEVDELVEIAKLMCKGLFYDIEPDAEVVLKEYLRKRMAMPYFSNARTVRNAVDRARMRAAVRIFNEKIASSSDGLVSRRELRILKPEDFVSAKELEARGETAIVE